MAADATAAAALAARITRRDAALARPLARRLHGLGTLLACWGVIGLLWTLPVPIRQLRAGSWAVLAIVLAFHWYWRRSHRLAPALLVLFTLAALAAHALFQATGPAVLAGTAGGALALAAASLAAGEWSAARRLRCPADAAAVLAAPAWLAHVLLRRPEA